MKTALNLMDKGCNTFYFYRKYKDIWHRTVKDLFKQSDMDCKYLRGCDSIDDTAEDNDCMLLYQNCWKPFPPLYYRTHTEEEIAAAIDAANKELDELLRMIEEKRKEIDG